MYGSRGSANVADSPLHLCGSPRNSTTCVASRASAAASAACAIGPPIGASVEVVVAAARIAGLRPVLPEPRERRRDPLEIVVGVARIGAEPVLRLLRAPAAPGHTGEPRRPWSGSAARRGPGGSAARGPPRPAPGRGRRSRGRRAASAPVRGGPPVRVVEQADALLAREASRPPGRAAAPRRYVPPPRAQAGV